MTIVPSLSKHNCLPGNVSDVKSQSTNISERKYSADKKAQNNFVTFQLSNA